MKTWTYAIIILGLALLFQLAGMPVAEDLLGKGGYNVETGVYNISDSILFSKSFGTAGLFLVVGAGIIIGLFAKSSVENYILLPFIF